MQTLGADSELRNLEARVQLAKIKPWCRGREDPPTPPHFTACARPDSGRSSAFDGSGTQAAFETIKSNGADTKRDHPFAPDCSPASPESLVPSQSHRALILATSGLIAVGAVVVVTATASASPSGERHDNERRGGFYMYCTPIDRTPGFYCTPADGQSGPNYPTPPVPITTPPPSKPPVTTAPPPVTTKPPTQTTKPKPPTTPPTAGGGLLG